MPEATSKRRVSLGYGLLSEEHGPRELVEHARLAEEAGFSFALISDHYHPWTDAQGQGPFVWTVLGALAQATERLQIGTGVTAPIMRIHPAIIAQAAATTAAMMPGRFFLGVGTGERLNEHILGDHWPPIAERREMLIEAIEVMRELWKGGLQSYDGMYFTVQQAQLYTLPDTPPPIFVASGGEKTAELAAEHGDGIIATSPESSLVQDFERAGGAAKPRIGMLHVCWAASEAEAVRTAHRHWPNSSLKGDLGQELARPRDFEAACARVREEDVAKTTVRGPDAERYVERIAQYVDADYDHVFMHQVGPDQRGFLDFCERKLMARFELVAPRLASRQAERREPVVAGRAGRDGH